MISALRMVQRNAIVYRHVWRGSVFSSFLQPTLFLLAMGTGVGALINHSSQGSHGSGVAALGGVSFIDFLAPGLLAAACMQSAGSESSFPIMAKMVWNRNYQAIAATPMSVADIVLGELSWIGLRLTMVAVTFALVSWAFGVPRSPVALLAIPAAVLTGLACSAGLLAFSATTKNGGEFSVVFRFVLTPLFLFSGVFFPVTQLPEPLRTVAWFTPLFHGVELVRGLMLDTFSSPIWLLHVAYLVVLLVVGTLTAVRTFGWKLRA